MVESIFVSPTELGGIENSGANHLIVTLYGLDTNTWRKLKELNVNLAITITVFGQDGCPANPQAKERLFAKIKDALEFAPQQIWIDHFRFDGHWEAIEGERIPEIHEPCEFCKDKSRVEVLQEIAREIIDKVEGRAKIGYFAVPFKSEEVPELITNLGQDHEVLGKIFDTTSPMLYQQMIKKPVSYISEYVKWISKKTSKPVLPIIQVKSMPDDLPDAFTEEIITSEFQEAIKKPSTGVCFFWWVHALEKNKTGIIKKLFASV